MPAASAVILADLEVCTGPVAAGCSETGTGMAAGTAVAAAGGEVHACGVTDRASRKETGF